MKVFALFLFFLVGLACYPASELRAQGAPDQSEATNLPFEKRTLSPTAASFAIYGEIPVSKYTGIPDITVPLYTLELNDFEMPISLSYHPAGTRVESEASWVGLGWTLNVGGVITREVRGTDDFASEYIEAPIGDGARTSGYWFRFNVIDYKCPVPTTIKDCYDETGDCRDYFAWLSCEQNPSILPNLLPTYTTKRILQADCDPDMFTYNFLGYTGRFVIDAETNKAILEKPEDNLLIQYKKWGDYHFYVTLPTGQELCFEMSEKTVPYMGYGYGIRSAYTSAWYLTSIELQNGEEIVFEYNGTDKVISNSYKTRTDELNFTRIYDVCSTSRVTKYATKTEIPQDEFAAAPDRFRTQHNGTYQYGTWIESELSLSKISTRGMEIQLVPKNRLDYGLVQGAFKFPVCLSQMIIKTARGVVKTFSFGHSYFGTEAGKEAVNDPVGKRLRLDYVQEGDLPPLPFYL